MEIICAVCGKKKEFESTLDAKASKWVDKGSYQGWACNNCIDNYNEEFYNPVNFEGEQVYEFA